MQNDQQDQQSGNHITRTLDVCGLNCPLPLLKAKQALNGMQVGEVLALVCTDPGSVRDFAVFSRQSGHPLLESMEADGKFHYQLQKAPQKA